MKIGEQRHLGGGLIAYQGVKGRTFYGRSIRLFGDNKTHILDARTEQEARGILAERSDIHRRRDLYLGEPSETSEPILYTFRQATDLWLEDLLTAGRDPKTPKRYRYDLNAAAALLDPDGTKSLDDIRVEDAKHLRAALMSHGGAFRTRKNVERTASMLFGYAMDDSRRWVTRNPFDSLLSEKAPRKTHKKAERFRRLHPREDAALLEACGKPMHQCLVAIGLYLGVRETPVACLRTEDINLFADVICVPCEFNKGVSKGSAREDFWLPIPRHLRQYLEPQIKAAADHPGGWLFPTSMFGGRQSRSGHIHPDKLRELMYRAAAKVGYDDANFHALRAVCNNRVRASGAADALAAGASAAMATLQHRSEETAAPYFDAIVSYMRPVMNAYDAWLDRQAEADEKIVELSRLRR